MTILVAVKKNGRVFLGADRMMTTGSEYAVDVVNGSKIIKLKHAYIATSGYTLLDNCIEHLYRTKHPMMENTFKNRNEVFQFFLDLYTELKKNYTLVDTGKDTFAAIYNVFLVATPYSIFSISQNLSVNEYTPVEAEALITVDTANDKTYMWIVTFRQIDETWKIADKRNLPRD